MLKLEQVKQQLLQQKVQLAERLEHIKSDIRHEHEPIEADFAEQATQRENDQVIDAIGNETAVNLIAIDKALDRLESGEYHVCETCGEEISPARLEALPTVTQCIDCARLNTH